MSELRSNEERRVSDRMIAAWRLCIEHKHEPQPGLGQFDWPRVLTRALDEIDRLQAEVSQLRAKIERVETHDEWATGEREHFRNQMFVERDRTERAEARIGAALAWLDDADPLPERNGNIFADLRTALAEPLGFTPEQPTDGAGS